MLIGCAYLHGGPRHDHVSIDQAQLLDASNVRRRSWEGPCEFLTQWCSIRKHETSWQPVHRRGKVNPCWRTTAKAEVFCSMHIYSRARQAQRLCTLKIRMRQMRCHIASLCRKQPTFVECASWSSDCVAKSGDQGWHSSPCRTYPPQRHRVSCSTRGLSPLLL